MMNGAFGGGWITMLLIWVVVIAAVVWIASRSFPSRSGGGDSRAADATSKQILDERFARGEIDADEYRRLRRELER